VNLRERALAEKVDQDHNATKNLRDWPQTPASPGAEGDLAGRSRAKSGRSRKRPRGAPTHVGRLRLDPTPAQARVMLARERAGDRVYNACLREALKRLEHLRADPGFEQAKAMPRGKARTDAFAALDKKHGFTEYALMSYASSLRTRDNGQKKQKVWVGELVGAHEAQVEGRDAFRTVREWSFGKRGKPRFRAYHERTVLSAECKDHGDIKPLMKGTQLVGIQWRRGFVVRIAAPQNKAEEAEQARIAALIAAGRLLYCRVVSRQIGGRWCHEAQFVLDGQAPLRHPVGSESKVSIDSGPSMLHVVHDTNSFHAEIAPSVEDKARELRRLLRHLDRQHRAGSPECFDEQGRHIKGACHWKIRSKAAKRTQIQIAEAHRSMAASRDSDHGRLANQIIAISPNIRTEDHGVKSWQTGLWSKSVARRGPGAQLARIERAAKRAGGSYIKVDSRLALSQTCVCGARVNKPLSQRRHICKACGLDVDRDLFSSFLMRHVVIEPDGTQHLDLDAARRELLGDPVLASMKREQEGVPAPVPVPLMRQDLGAGPEETLSGEEKQ
jgi:putative transposase